MRRALRLLGRLLLVPVLLVLALLAPVAWVEATCRGTPVADGYRPLLPEADRRPEARTLLTWPEWHIVHAYEDYAEVIRTGDPHDFGFLRSIGGFWSSLCSVNRRAAAHGGVDGGTRQMVYVIGVSFTAELLAKAAYEETAGRVATWIRGAERAPLDDLSARQAADYAAFLRQVPWYRWDFRRDAAALDAAATGQWRDREREAALGLEYRAKALYAGVIGQAVANVGPDALTLRMIVAGMTPEALAALPEVTVIAERPEGVEVETPRYAALTVLLVDMARQGAEFVETAGNDDILLTALSPDRGAPKSIADLPRQGFGDWRHLILLKVADLAPALRGMRDGPLRLEHVHDY